MATAIVAVGIAEAEESEAGLKMKIGVSLIWSTMAGDPPVKANTTCLNKPHGLCRHANGCSQSL